MSCFGYIKMRPLFKNILNSVPQMICESYIYKKVILKSVAAPALKTPKEVGGGGV